MENQTFEDNRLIFLEQFNNLFQKQMFSEALTLAEEQLRQHPLDAEAYVATGKVLIAKDLRGEAHRMLCDLECNISALSEVFVRLGNLYEEKGYIQDARYCYQKFAAFNSSSERGGLSTQPKIIFEDVQKTDSNTDHKDQPTPSVHLLNTLSGWLVNIHRIKTYAANHQ